MPRQRERSIIGEGRDTQRPGRATITDIIDTSSDEGVWLHLTEPDGAQLHAFLHHDVANPEAGCTIFWPASPRPSRFQDFYTDALARVTEFRPDQRRFSRLMAYDRDTAAEHELDAAIPADLNAFGFLRFEYLSVGRDGVTRPILVAWLNLETSDPDAVDSAGVLFQPRHLGPITQPLATLVANSSTETPALASVVALIDALQDYLNPRQQPLVAAA